MQVKPINYKKVKLIPININKTSKPKSINNIYFLSNDQVETIHLPIESCSLIGVGNPHLLHVMSMLLQNNIDIKNVDIFDSNIDQLWHLNYLISSIFTSKDRIDFIEKTLCTKFNIRAKQILKKYVPKGKVEIKGWAKEIENTCFETEKKLWSNCSFDQSAFFKKYGIKAVKVDRGIFLSNLKTVGKHLSGCITLISGDTDIYPEGPFMFSYGFGYLKSEKEFSQLKNFLKRQDSLNYYKANVLTALKYSLKKYRYHNLVTWTSNIFAPYFVQKFPNVRDAINFAINKEILASISSKRIFHICAEDITSNLPKIMEFNSSYNILPIRDAHWAAYQKVNAFMGKKCIHVIGGKLNKEISATNDELESDQVISYTKIGRLNKTTDSIFLHTTFGRTNITPSVFYNLIDKSRKVARIVIILEHNDTEELNKDIVNSNYDGRPITDEIKKYILLNYKPTHVFTLPGKEVDNRNSLFIIKGNLY
jgi:hypothetical protein